ncbi:MAG: hypothetical protein JXR31_13365, partial [Prolixibacteraceae bacterium]|nr:hypothetical protein [Prolixibacteraceae bacterium]
MKKFLILIPLIISSLTGFAQKTYSLKVETSVSDDVKQLFNTNGRLFLFVSNSSREPRYGTWPNSSNKIFALNLKGWNINTPFTFDGSVKLSKSVDVNLDDLEEGNYSVQVLWDQDTNESGINAPGNLYSKTIPVELNKNTQIEIVIDQVIPPTQFNETEYLKLVDMKSEKVSKFWEKEMRIKAAVLLPSGYYKNPDAKYPVRYN